VKHCLCCQKSVTTQSLYNIDSRTALSSVATVIYIDTKNDLCVERLVEVADASLSTNDAGDASTNDDARSTKVARILGRIKIARVNDLSTLSKVLHDVADSKVVQLTFTKGVDFETWDNRKSF
jgi:hypothetical protein